MKIKGCLFVLGILFSFSSIASLEECQITNGTVGFCGSWSQEKEFPVKQSDGTYDKCSITNGSVGFCGSWYNGTAVIEK